jgi:hypothetical protein
MYVKHPMNQPGADTKPCPLCGETIKASASKCIYCEELFDKGTLGFKGKTLWDLLALLVVPLALAGMGFWFSSSQRSRQIAGDSRLRQTSNAATATQQTVNVAATGTREAENTAAAEIRQAEQAAVAAARATEVSLVEMDRAQEAALQVYFDRMSDLLIKEMLRTSEEGAEVRDVARTRTLTVLRRLDPERKGALLLFLYGSKLVVGKGIINLSGADLRQANLREANLIGADLSAVKLREADLSGANLRGITLFRADLREANFHNANLGGADLQGTDLHGADLSGAVLIRVDLTGARYSSDTHWPDNFDPKAHQAVNVDEHID